MKTFKTNINCAGCVAKVTPILDGEEKIQKWTVDTTHPQKVLEIESGTLTESDVIKLVQDAGFKIEVITE